MQLSNMQAEFVELLFDENTSNELPLSAENIKHYKKRIEDRFIKYFYSIYPMIKYFIGNTIFIDLVKEHIKYFPCRYSDVNDYGEFFADRAEDDDLLLDFPYLSDLAKFEWRCHELSLLIDHKESVPSANHRIQILNKTHVTLNQTCRIEQFNCPVLSLRECFLKKQNFSSSPPYQPNYLFMYRPQFKLQFFRLEKTEWVFLTALQNQATIAEALNAAQMIDPGFQLPDLLAMIEKKIIVE